MENKIDYIIDSDSITIYFYGELDSTNAPKYRVELTSIFERNRADVIFDFSHTTFIDSSGIGLVIGRYNQLQMEDRKLSIKGLNATAYKLFELSGIFRIMEYKE